MKRQKFYLTTSVIALLIGLAVSAYLTSKHNALMYGMSDSKSLCSINPTFDCDAVNTSQFSSLFGIPVALFGFFSFLAQLLLVFGIRILSDEEATVVRRYFFYLALLNVIPVLVLGVISAVVLKTFCLFCLVMYIIILYVAFASYKLLPPGQKKFSLTGGSWGIFSIFLLIPLGSFAAHNMMNQINAEQFNRFASQSIYQWKESRKIDFFMEDAPYLGNASAPIQIVEFSDFQCPHCKRAAPSLEAFANRHRDEVKVYFQSYPLDSACNPAIKGAGQKVSCLMTRASICAHKQNRYFEAHDWIFKHQETLTTTSIDELVNSLKLDKESFHSCLNSSDTEKTLSQQVERGKLAGVEGTPTIFFDGRLLPGGFLIPILEEALTQVKSTRP